MTGGNISLEDFNNDYTLNIFCDASIRKYEKRTAGCYGAVAYNGNNKIDEEFRKKDFESTSNNCEIRAIRLGVRLALKYQYNFQNINLFSDSQISIFGIRDRIFSWVQYGNFLYGYDHNKIKNQEIFVEIVDTIIQNNLRINFWHQAGHIKLNNFEKLNKAIHVFQASNAVRGLVDINFIKYISDKNNEVDKLSRDLLYIKDDTKYYGDAFTYQANDEFKDKLELFRYLQAN